MKNGVRMEKRFVRSTKTTFGASARLGRSHGTTKTTKLVVQQRFEGQKEKVLVRIDEQGQTSALRTSEEHLTDSGESVNHSVGLCQHIGNYISLKVRNVFLPQGYPDTVSSWYMTYTMWNFLSVVTGSLAGILSTQALLLTVGLGHGAIPVAATLNWIIKDGFGQFGGAIYAGAVSRGFDTDPKRQRIVSCLSMQFAYALDVATLLCPSMFLLIASASNVCKNIAWLSSSASRAAIVRASSAEDENAGDVTAKSGTQATVGGLIGSAIKDSCVVPETNWAV